MASKTGYYIRFRRDGVVQELGIDELADAELAEFEANQLVAGGPNYADAGWRWAIKLAKWIRDNVQEEYKLREGWEEALEAAAPAEVPDEPA